MTLFTVANMLKKIIAKLMATHFHGTVHFEKMQNALKKARERLIRPHAGCR